jgi:dephospho-CoA kinase
MFTVALTGGIGCGKSAVSSYLQSLNVPVIDADVIAHRLVEPGSSALREIQTTFGANLVDAGGCLNRAALREIVFNDPQQRKRLEAILHPRIQARMQAWLADQTAPYAIVVIPLLFETKQAFLADRILVVDCDEALQIQRVTQRDGLSHQQIAQIMASQVDRQTRRQGADDIIENNGDRTSLIAATEQLHQYYLKLAYNSHA